MLMDLALEKQGVRGAIESLRYLPGMDESDQVLVLSNLSSSNWEETSVGQGKSAAC